MGKGMGKELRVSGEGRQMNEELIIIIYNWYGMCLKNDIAVIHGENGEEEDGKAIIDEKNIRKKIRNTVN